MIRIVQNQQLIYDYFMALTKKDILLIGDEMVRVLEPVYQDMGAMKADIKTIKGQIGELTDKVDALTGDMIDLQNMAGATKDQLVGIQAIITDDRRDIKLLKKHTGLSLN